MGEAVLAYGRELKYSQACTIKQHDASKEKNSFIKYDSYRLFKIPT